MIYLITKVNIYNSSKTQKSITERATIGLQLFEQVFIFVC